MQPAKRRILFLITTSDWGGAQYFVHRIAQESQRRGFDVLVAAGSDGELEPHCREAGIPFRTLRTVRREISPFHDLAALHEIRRLIRSYAPDVVHLNSSKMSVLGSIAAQLEHVPRTIYRIGGWSFLEDLGWVKRQVYLRSEQATASKKDFIVTVHPGDETTARAMGIQPRGSLLTIPNGIPLEEADAKRLARDDARKKLGLSPDDVVIGTVANFYPPKNIPWYLETIAPLVQERRNVRFIIFGDGPERKRVHAVHARLGLGDRVLLAGRRDDASALLSACDLFVLPSSKEGMPWTLLEAMAARIACIATDVGACRWMLEPANGIIVPPKHPEKLRSAILALLENPPYRAQLAENGRRRVESRFRWETTVEKTLELFRT